MTAQLELQDDAHCFVCGDQNPVGLKLHWKTHDNQTRAEFTLQKSFQGWKGLVHGGILATILDEAMTRLAWQLYGGAVTAEITVRYHRPARVGEILAVAGEVEPPQNRIIKTKAFITNTNGDKIASAIGKAVQPKGERNS